jgi:hypothetical protein
MNEENVAYIHNEVLLTYKEEQNYGFSQVKE